MQTVIEKIKSLKIKRIGCACLLLALLPAVAAAGAQTLDEQVDRIFRDAKTVGGAFLVAQEGEIVYERYYGEQQKTTHVPVTEKSYFRCASVTKLVTGIGLMRMMDDGLLDPDEDISVYLGYEAGNPRYPDVPITLRMLMSHTSGLNENSSYSSLSSKLSNMIALDKKAAANFKDVRPGSQYAYSNFGAGVTGAIILGGPGAVFWMWVSALFGMVTKFSEVTLAVKYRERNEKGDWCGGPMYYIKNGLGPKWKWLGTVFAVLGAIAAFGIGNIAQVNSIADSVKSVAIAFNEDAANKEMLICLITGICVAIFVALVLLGGVKRIGQVTEKLVPGMAVIYIVCALVVVFANLSAVPGVFASIFKGAFNPAAVTGGAAGMSIKLAMTKGVGRGVFSNEAGLGSAPIAHAATSEKNPVKQGLYGIFEVFMDTIVICTLTALVVLCSGAADGNYGNNAAAGVSTTVAGFSSVFGAKAGSVILAVGLLLFATSTILGWALYGTRCAEFLFGSKIIRPYQIIFCLVVVAGAVADLTLVWDISDTLNGLMSIPNLIALLLLSPVVIKLTREHFAGLRK